MKLIDAPSAIVKAPPEPAVESSESAVTLTFPLPELRSAAAAKLTSSLDTRVITPASVEIAFAGR